MAGSLPGWERIARGVWIARPYLDRQKSEFREDWCVVVQHRRYREGRRRYIRVGPDRGLATLRAKKIARALSAGTDETPTVDAVLLAWWDEYSSSFKPSTRETFGTQVHRHLLPAFEHVPVTELSDKRLLRFVEDHINVRHSPWAVRNALGVLRQAINRLWAERIEAFRGWNPPIGQNPSRRIGEVIEKTFDAHADEIKKREAFTHREARILLRIAREKLRRFYPVLLLGFSTGMRQGEIRALKWSDINWTTRTVVLRRAMSLDRPSVPKGGHNSGGRIVHVPPHVADVLVTLFQERRPGSVWVFETRNGTPLMKRNLIRWMEKLLDLAEPFGVRRLSFHSTRHSFVSAARGAGADPVWLAKQVGHYSPSYTDSVYVHLDGERKRDFSWADFESEHAPVTSCHSVVTGSLDEATLPDDELTTH